MIEDNWQPQRTNDSRPGLISDGIKFSDTFQTVTRVDYKWPVKEEIPHARRKKLLRSFMFQKLAPNYLKELTDPSFDEYMEVESLYKETFRGDGFQVKDIVESADPEEIVKYPVYTDQAHSVYFDKLRKIKTTVPSDPAAAFRKFSYFSKPFYAELE